MATLPTPEITTLLQAWSGGDEAALEQLVPLVEPELRRAARQLLLGKRSDPILETTALINELYIRLIDGNRCGWNNRAHFFAACAKTMRCILVDQARSRLAAKRGGELEHLPLDDSMPAADQGSNLVAVDEALEALARVDARKARVVELRFFGGLNAGEVAEVLEVSIETVQRDWRLAKAWLFRELQRGKL